MEARNLWHTVPRAATCALPLPAYREIAPAAPLLRRALEAGYGDASHLVRDTRLLTGLTPTDSLA